jgi:O-antigen/teichoic acid export membrane protein
MNRSHWIPIVGNQAATLVIGVVGLKLISHLVPPAVNGVYALFLTLTQLGTLLTHSGIINHAARNWQRESPRQGSYARYLWRASWTALAYLAPILALISGAMFLGTREAGWLFAFPLLLAGNLALAQTEMGALALNAGERHWAVLGLRTGGVAARIFFPVLGVVAFGASFLALASGFALHSLVVIGFILALFRQAWTAQPAESDTLERWRRELREYGRPFILMGIGGWLLQSSDRWIVIKFYGEQKAGLFALATSMGSIVPALLLAALMQRIFPEIFRQADAARRREDWVALARRCDRATLVFVLFSGLGLVFLRLVAPHLVGWLIHARYQDAMSMVLAAGLAMVTVQVNQFQYMLLQGQHNSIAMVRVMAAVAGVKTAGSIIAAAISWSAFMVWLAVSVPVSAWLGRFLIHRIGLNAPPVLVVERS